MELGFGVGDLDPDVGTQTNKRQKRSFISKKSDRFKNWSFCLGRPQEAPSPSP